MIIQIGISRYRFIYLDLVSIVVSWVTSPFKSIVLSQISIFFPLREIRNVSTVEGEATPTRSVPLPEKEEELREEEWGGARWQWPGQWMMPITSPYIFITSTKIKSTISHLFYVTAANEFSYNFLPSLKAILENIFLRSLQKNKNRWLIFLRGTRSSKVSKWFIISHFH